MYANVATSAWSCRHANSLLNLNAQFSEVFLIPHILIGVLGLVEGEDFFVDDRLDVVGLDGAVHLFELKPAADEDAADGADVVLMRS